MSAKTPAFSTVLPSLDDQFDRLVSLGIVATDDRPLLPRSSAGLLVPPHGVASPRSMMQFITYGGKPGFVVEDMTDLEDFVPTPEADRPADQWYILSDVQRGDEFSNASPKEALADISAAGRTPLTLSDGVTWLIQQPDALARNNCFMTIASRKPKPGGGYDSRTPALWISNGTGRDGAANKNAPKLGWCWWRNRHTWLGIAHAARVSL